MMTETTTAHLADGQTLNVTLDIDGTTRDGELTVVGVESEDTAYVENGRGDRFELSYFMTEMNSGRDVPALKQHGDTLAHVVEMEVA